MIPSALGRLGGIRTVNITSNQTNYNLRTALGSPAGAMRIIVNIASGVTIRSSVSTTPAFDEGSGWAAGTLITINNAGNIYGGGGLGGAGGTGLQSPSRATAGANGSAGGTALKLGAPTWINNAAGAIFGGGGGGGGAGGANGYIAGESSTYIMYGGGGGGSGQSGATTGVAAGGVATQGNYNYSGGAGNAGGVGGAGSGGLGGNSAPIGVIAAALDGGTGGAWGTAGASVGTPGNPGVDVWIAGAGGSGGAAGKAVDLNSQTLTWISGNDPSRVKGAVS